MLADPALPAALTVAIAHDPWPEGSHGLQDDPDWREILIPAGTASPSTASTRPATP